MTLQSFIPLKAGTGIAALAFAAVVMPLPAAADAFFFSTGDPDGKIATRPRRVMTSFSPSRPPRSLRRASLVSSLAPYHRG